MTSMCMLVYVNDVQLYQFEVLMKTERLVVLMEPEVKSKLKKYATTNGHTLAYVINKLVVDFIKWREDGTKVRRKTIK